MLEPGCSPPHSSAKRYQSHTSGAQPLPPSRPPARRRAHAPPRSSPNPTCLMVARVAVAAALAAALARCAPAAAQLTVMGNPDYVVFEHFPNPDCTGTVEAGVYEANSACTGPWVAADPEVTTTNSTYFYSVDVDGKMEPYTTFWAAWRTDCEKKTYERLVYLDPKCKKPMGGKKKQVALFVDQLDKECRLISNGVSFRCVCPRLQQWPWSAARAARTPF